MFSFNVAAVQRKYEALRRTWKMDDNEDIILKKAKDKKYRVNMCNHSYFVCILLSC